MFSLYDYVYHYKLFTLFDSRLKSYTVLYWGLSISPVYHPPRMCTLTLTHYLFLCLFCVSLSNLNSPQTQSFSPLLQITTTNQAFLFSSTILSFLLNIIFCLFLPLKVSEFHTGRHHWNITNTDKQTNTKHKQTKLTSTREREREREKVCHSMTITINYNGAQESSSLFLESFILPLSLSLSLSLSPCLSTLIWIWCALQVPLYKSYSFDIHNLQHWRRQFSNDEFSFPLFLEKREKIRL